MPTLSPLTRNIAVLVTALTPTLLSAQTESPRERLEKPATEAISPVDLDEIVVTDERADIGYSAPVAESATKTELRRLETPQAVSVVNRQLIEDQGARKLEEVLRNTAGISPGGYYGDWDYYRIRGFDAAFKTYWDGLRGDYGKNVEIFGADRVEILKGPSSSLYGQGPLGGLVNVVSKKPLRENFADVAFTIGSYDFYEPTLDAGMILNSAGTVYLRLNALYREQDSFIDFVEKSRVFIAPSLTWEIGPNTTLTFLTSYVHDRDVLAMPLPAKGTVLPNKNGSIPIGRYNGEPDHPNEVDQWRVRLGYQFRHQFNEIFSLRQNFEVSRLWQDWNHIYYPSALDVDERTLYRYPYSTREEYDRIAVDTSMDAKFRTGPVEHVVTAGIDFFRTDTSNTTEQINYADFPGSYPAIDLFSPSYDGLLPAFASLTKTNTEIKWWGLYLQEHAKFWGRFTLLLSGRYDATESGNADEEALTGRVGLTYEFVKGLALYGNYSQSFDPQWYSLDAAGNPVEPERGENMEVGLKAELWDGRFTGTVSLFQLTRENLATQNLATPSVFDAIVSGEQRSRGVEVEGAVRLAPGWDFTFAYTYLDAEITQDNVLPVGFRLAGVPEHAFSAWTKYTIQQGPLKGLGFGVGARYYTAQQGDHTYANPFNLPAYGLVDAAISYDRGPFHAQLTVHNLLNREYYVGAYNDLYVLPGEPLQIRATVGWRF